jgi:hypothetical protein
MSPMTMSFLGAGAVALVGIILVLIFDRHKSGKGAPSDGKNQSPR